jgi:hypothetical protein
MLDEQHRRHDDPPAIGSPERGGRSDGASLAANLLVGATVALLLAALVVLVLVR